MDSIITVLLGLVVGTYFAEPIRETVPLLDPNKKEST